MGSFISTVFKLILLLVLVVVVLTMPPVVNYFAPTFVSPLVDKVLPSLGLLEPKYSANKYTFALPIGIKAKGVSLDFEYQYPDLNKIGLILSGDEISIRVLPLESFKQQKIVLESSFDGLVIKSKLLPEKSVATSSYDYQRFLIRNGSFEREIDIKPFYDFKSYQEKIRDAIMVWKRTPIQLQGDLEISILSKRYQVPIREVEEDHIVLDRMLLSDLSLAYRKPFLESEIDFMQKHPLCALDILSARLMAEEKAVIIYPLDLDALAKTSYLLYHYELSDHLGIAASTFISSTDIGPDYELGSSMGRAAFKRGLTLEKLSSPELVGKLIATN